MGSLTIIRFIACLFTNSILRHFHGAGEIALGKAFAR